MNLLNAKVVVKPGRAFSSEEKKVFFVVQKFLQGIARKDKLLLEEVLAEDAKIELRWRQKGEVVPKDKYIQIVTAGNSSSYRSDFQFLDVIIEMHKNWALAKGIFMFQDEPFSSSLLWIKLIKRCRKWLIFSNGFSFFNFQTELTII